MPKLKKRVAPPMTDERWASINEDRHAKLVLGKALHLRRLALLRRDHYDELSGVGLALLDNRIVEAVADLRRAGFPLLARDMLEGQRVPEELREAAARG